MTKSRWSISKEIGFTLIEMMVVFAIVVIMASIIMIDYGANRLKLALLRSAQKLSLDLHRVETYSLTSKEFQASGVPDGWGVHFYGANSTTYTIFADRNPGNANIRDPNGSEDLETLNFETGIKISPAPNITDVIFIPPDPDVVFTPSVPSASIILTTPNGSLTRTITINKFGAVTISSP